MKIVNICSDDWANFSYDNAMALASIGVDCKSYKLNKHVFGYKNESELVSLEKMREIIAHADIVNYIHGSISLFNATFGASSNKKIIVTYTGSAYRNAPEQHNEIFNPGVSLSLTDQCEFLNLGGKNIKYISTAIDLNNFPEPDFTLNAPYVFGHFPSNPEVKGTKEIINMMEMINVPLIYANQNVSHEQQINRMKKCDIYIELFKPELNGRPYGCFGVTAFEAAAMGKIVITNNVNYKVYEESYGWCALCIANTPQEFYLSVKYLQSASKEEIELRKKESYKWIKDTHSYEASGKYLKNILWKI